MIMRDTHFTHHARRQWAFRFDDIGDAIEDEFAVAKPASKKVRRILLRNGRSHIRKQRQRGAKPIFFVSRRCVFPTVKYPDGRVVVLTVFNRHRSIK